MTAPPPQFNDQALRSAAVLHYAPFASGKYDVSSPGLHYLQVEAALQADAAPEKRLFQIDRDYPLYLHNKQHCRQENLGKYYLEQDFSPASQRAVNQTILEHLCKAYPQWFRWEQRVLHCLLSGDQLSISHDLELQAHPSYLSLFDALASQLQEDLAVWQLQGDQDWLAALHVCAPNFWAPSEKIGKTFAEVHQAVPGMEAQRANYLPMLKGLIQKPAFYRFIWDFKTRSRLNHHPIAPPEISAEAWLLPAFSAARPELYVRVERQVLYGLPACNAVLFAIRTYLYKIETLALTDLQGLEQALATLAKPLLKYKNLEKSQAAIQHWLAEVIAHKRANGADGTTQRPPDV